jgi:CheY-like chemotaxis protein
VAIISNLTIDQGTTFTANIDCTAADDNALNLTGYTVAGQLRKTYDSTTSTPFTAIVANALTGRLQISLTPTQTGALSAGRYVYDVEITDQAGIITRVVEGQVEITPGVTR